ncbi:MAG: cyclic nucleotide-binding domain-containing protein [Actinomycetota bacterium]
MAETRGLQAGDTLFAIGDDGDTVYVIEDGELEVVTPLLDGGELVVGTLGPDDIVGEITAVIGGQRSATVRAVTDARVLELSGSDFDEWLDQHGEQAARIAGDARSRMDRTRVARVVAELVGPDQPELIEAMTESVEWVTVDAGQALFEQGDMADAAYILVGGQMRVHASDGEQTTLDTRIGRGDLLGEMGVIEQAPRMASARAIRDCTLARIPKTTFERLTAEYPSLMLPLVRKVLARVSDRSTKNPHAGNIALIVTDPSGCATTVATIADEIARHGPTLHLNAEVVARFLNRRDIANAKRGSAADSRLIEFLHEVDVAHRWVVLECDEPTSDWTRRALRTADRVALVASPNPGPDERKAIEDVRSQLEATGDFDLWAVQANAATGWPTGTKRLAERTGASRVLHVRRDDERTARRVGRLLSGNGLGVAFSGGGARSFGQIGAMQAMKELGLEVDAVAGTSMGAVMAAVAAAIDDPGEAAEITDTRFTGIKLLDYTIPLTSIFAGKLLTDRISDFFGGVFVEDLMLPFVCISTNLTTAKLVEHRSGDVVHALRASVSLPGVFPPVPMDGDLLVDGGVLENLPARPLREDPGISTVIAIDVAPPDGPKAKSDFGLALSGFDILKRRVRREEFATPALAHTVISSMLVGSAQARHQALDNADIDLYMSLDLSGVKLLDFSALKPAIERGRDDARPKLERWLAERQDNASVQGDTSSPG